MGHDMNDSLDVAIVGMAGRFPGADTIEEYWRIIADGAEQITRFSDHDLAAAGVPEDERRHPDYVPAYGVIDGIEDFDAAFFGYSPRDASIIDPQQRVFLECARAALESAGHLAADPGELVGVYAGTAASSYLLHHLMPNARLRDSVTEYELLLGNDKDSLATRVAYHLDLRGPAVSVQTTCSSSLVAVHQAAQALLARECDVALAGGVHLRLPMRSGYRYQTGGIMSRDGACRAFDAEATGTVGGNGAAVVVLRRLADARRDGDTVYAVIKGSAINNDGAVKIGFTAPGVDGQAAVIRAAQAVAEIDSATIGYIEAHGTGTSLGDQIELRALTDVFGHRSGRAGSCRLGTVKALIGHLDAAAGVAGLIKTALALHHGVIPPSPYFRSPHPALADSPFEVNTEPVPWPRLGGPRRAGVSSFGIGGTNAHVVLEEAAAVPAGASARAEHLLVLSARSAPALDELRAQLAERLRHGDEPLADVAYTLQVGRPRLPHRLAVVCRDRRTAADLAGARTAVDDRIDATVALLFPGQGAQHVGMGRHLYRSEPTFRRHVDACADALRHHVGVDLRELLYPPAGGEDAAAGRLRQTRLTQPALFTVEYALAQLWAQWGVTPAAMVGHSIGEYVAACLAGVFDLDAALEAVAVRGRLMQTMPHGAMVAVPLPADEIEPRLPDGVTLAAANAPRLSVVAGTAPAIAAYTAALAADGVEARPLHTSHAFHSPMMEPVMEAFADHLSRFQLRPPRTPVLSNVTGDWLTAAQATDPAYWAEQLRRPVRFDSCARRLAAAGHVLLEVGPGTTLATLARQQDGADGRRVVSSLSHPGRPVPDGAALADALGRLWLAGVPVDWAGVWAQERRRRRPLPTYPFQRQRHWVERPAPATGGAATPRPDLGRPPVSCDPADDAAAPASGDAGGAAPADPTMEDVIRRIWIDLLGVADVGDADDFFELGGHSLLGTQVVARVRDTFGVDLHPSAIFQTPTVAGLADTIRRHQAAPAADSDQPDDDTADVLLPDLLAEIRAMTPEQLREQLARELDGLAE